MTDPRSEMSNTVILSQDEYDLMREIIEAARYLREQQTNTMVLRVSRQKAESLLDLALSNYSGAI